MKTRILVSLFGLGLVLTATAFKAQAAGGSGIGTSSPPANDTPLSIATFVDYEPTFAFKNGTTANVSKPLGALVARYKVTPGNTIYGQLYGFPLNGEFYPALSLGASHALQWQEYRFSVWGQGSYVFSPRQDISAAVILKTGLTLPISQTNLALGVYIRHTRAVSTGINYLGPGARVTYKLPNNVILFAGGDQNFRLGSPGEGFFNGYVGVEIPLF